MSRWTHVTQGVLAMIAIALVSTLFLGGMVGGGKAPDQPASSSSPGPVEPTAPAEGERMPGTPEQPLDSYATFPAPENRNADRQVAYESTATPRVEFLDSLGDQAAYATQKFEWKLCDDDSGDQCATVLAPLDWDEPQGPAIELAIRRVVDGDSSRGPLFLNPGGPGFGGQSMATGLAGRFDNFDLIGWDPRGTGESTHVVCGSLTETDALFDLDTSPDDAAEDKALQDGSAAFARQCRDNSGDLLDHITTIDVVRDLDLLRHLVGAEKLNYVGVSYGTFVGATYAHLFPHSVGRMILDAAVEITDSEPIPQTAGFELALDNFIDWCAGSDLCSLGDDAVAIKTQLTDFLTRLDADPVDVNGRQLTQSHAATGIALFLYEDDEAYRTLADVIGRALTGDAADLLLAADILNGRSGNAYDTVAYAFPAMACVDGVDEGAAPVLAEWKDTFDDAPFMAPQMGTSYTCQLWTADSAPQLKLTADGAPTILVVGTTGDSATPYEQAVSMAGQLASGTLLTLESAGHGAVTGDNACIAKAVNRFLYEGEAPEDGTRCS